MSERFSDETLIAYLDGELPSEELARIEQALENDAEARQFIEDMCLLDNRLARELDEAAFGPGLDDLKRTADAAAGLSSPRPAKSHRWAAGLAAALAVGLLSGYLLGNSGLERRLDALEQARMQDRELLRSTVNRALEKVASGQVVTWRSPSTPAQATVRPIRTFKTEDGRWCREYERIWRSGDRSETERAIACRRGSGDWRVRLTAIDG